MSIKYGTTLLRAMLRNMKTWRRKIICWYGMRWGNIVWSMEKEDGRRVWADKMEELEVKKIEARDARVEEQETSSSGAGKTESNRESSPAKIDPKRT